MNTATLPILQHYACPPGCGACCSLIVEADASDVLREPRINEVYPFKGTPDRLAEGCWALIGGGSDHCKFLDSEKRCSIYATRPAACVNFQAGSKQCQMARAMRGFAPLEPSGEASGPLALIGAQIREFCDEEDES